MADQEKMREELKALRQHLDDLTRNLDESPALEKDDTLAAELETARKRVKELEAKLGPAG